MRKIFLALILSLLFVIGVFAASQGTSSTTAATLITQVRYVLNEDVTGSPFWTDTELLQWINEGMADISFKAHCLENTESVTLVAATGEYTLSTSTYIGVIAAVYNDASSVKLSLKKGTPARIGRIDQDDLPAADRVPEFWYEWNGKIGIYPALSSVTTETVTVYLVEMPAAIASSGDVSTPAIFDNALRAFVISRALYKDRQFQKAARWEAKYESEINRYRQDFIELPREIE